MTNNENYMRDRLYNLEAPYPGDMWQRIEASLPEKKDDRKLWLFFLIFLLMAMIPASIYMISQPAEKEPTEGLTITSRSNYTENSNNGETLALTDISEQKEGVGSEKDKDISSMTITTTNQSNHHNKQKTAYTISNFENDQLIPTSKEEEKAEITGSTAIDIFETPKIENILEENIENRSILPDISMLAMPSHGLSNQYAFDPPECPTFTFGGESGMYIDFVYSHDYGMQSLIAKSQEFNPYVGERENTESALYSFSAGVRISYISGSGFGLKTGLNYTQINEKFEYLDPDASLIRTIITIDTLLVGGVPTVVSDTATIRIPGSLDITAYNRYRFIDIPILFTYESYLTDKIYYNINAGALINLSFTQKGRFLDPAGDPVWFTKSDPDAYDAFKSSAGLSLYGSVGLHYQLNSTFDIIIEPNFRLFAGSLTNEIYPLEQKWLTGGLITGLRYKF